MHFAKHEFPYAEGYFHDRCRSVGEIVPETSRGQEGYRFRHIWRQWNGNVQVIPQILRQIYQDASLQTTKYDMFTLLEVNQWNTPRLIIAYDDDKSQNDGSRKPIAESLLRYAISVLLGKPDVFSQALLAIEKGMYLAGVVVSQLDCRPIVEYAKESLPIMTKNEDDLGDLWNVISFPGELQPPYLPILDDKNHKDIRLWRCLGSGSTGTVYEASYPDSKKRFAAKINRTINDDETFLIEDLQKATTMRSVKDIKLRTTTMNGFFADLFLSPLGGVLLPICYVPSEYQAELKLKHFVEILFELQEMHKAGFILRDLSLNNYILDGATKKARLVDFGSVC